MRNKDNATSLVNTLSASKLLNFIFKINKYRKWNTYTIMDITELHSLLSVGEQTRKVEIKRSISWDDRDHRAKIVKTILGLSNIRDGGYLVIGVEQRGDEFVFQGIEEDHLSSYNYDNVATECSLYADPFVEFTMEDVSDESGKKYLVFKVNEFSEIPVICKKNGRENLREGSVYTRPRGIPSTIRVPNQSEMRDIIELATEKGLRKYFETTRRAQLVLGISDDEDDGYDKELEDIK